MDFALSEEQTAIYDMARDFGQVEIAPHARDWDRQGSIPKSLWPKLAELGFGGLYVREENGGSGLTRLDATLVFEGLARSDISVATFLSIHNMCATMLDKFGSDAVKKLHLAPRGHDGQSDLLLPDRTGFRQRCRGAENPRCAHQRRL